VRFRWYLEELGRRPGEEGIVRRRHRAAEDKFCQDRRGKQAGFEQVITILHKFLVRHAHDVVRADRSPWLHVKGESCLIFYNSISKMASLLCLQDVEKLSGTFQSFCSQIIIKKMGNPFEMSALHIERSG
jgi:hypothetical protein